MRKEAIEKKQVHIWRKYRRGTWESITETWTFFSEGNTGYKWAMSLNLQCRRPTWPHKNSLFVSNTAKIVSVFHNTLNLKTNKLWDLRLGALGQVWVWLGGARQGTSHLCLLRFVLYSNGSIVWSSNDHWPRSLGVSDYTLVFKLNLLFARRCFSGEAANCPGCCFVWETNVPVLEKRRMIAGDGVLPWLQGRRARCCMSRPLWFSLHSPFAFIL